MKHYPVPSFRGQSLRRRILGPFLLGLILLGLAATVGSGLVIIEALSQEADERLLALKEIIFREIKEQEILLDTYGDLLSFTRGATSSTTDPQQLKTLDHHIVQALHGANIKLEYHSLGSWESPQHPLADFFDQALRSGRPRFRLLSKEGSSPTLAMATVVYQGDTPQAVLQLETPLNRAFLHQLSGPFTTLTFLLSRDGKLLESSSSGISLPPLEPKELASILRGEKFFKTVNTPLPHRQIFYAVPLGTTEMVVIALDTPLTQMNSVLQAMVTRSALTIAAALLIGGYFYFRRVNQVLAPIGEMVAATEKITQGQLDYRISGCHEGELGYLATSLNGMVDELSSLHREKLSQGIILTLAQEERKYKEILEKKNTEIEISNRELKTHLAELSTLFQLNQAMISTLDLNVLFNRILKALQDVIHCDEIVLLLYNQGMEELEIRKVHGFDPERLKGVSFRLDEGVTGMVARTLEPVYIRDLANDSRTLGYKGRTHRRGSMISLPMTFKNHLVGVLNLHKEGTNAFAESEINLAQALANQAAIAVENAQLFELTRDLSNTDELTGLANRRHFQEAFQRELAQAQRFPSHFSLIMADIDHFKAFNDNHGHLTGDVALKKVASIILLNTRGIDLVGRFGGEEFVILLPKTTKEGALAAAEKLRQSVEQEAFTGDRQGQTAARLTLSLGVATFPTDSKDSYQLIDRADRALYRAKQAGRNQVQAWQEQQD